MATLATACGSRQATPAALPPLADSFPLLALDEPTLCEALRTAPLVWTDPESARRRKLVVSDIHLGPGAGATGELAGVEDFVSQAEWQALLAREAPGPPTDLIIAGDLIDFWQIAGGIGVPVKRDESDSLLTLDVALASHPDFFAVLRGFLAAGDHRVIFVRGNHDADLVWPRVQLRIAEVLGAKGLRQLVFAPALGYAHGGVHVEHGHHFDGANTPLRELAPVELGPDGHCRLRPVWGEVFLAEVFNEVERRMPFVDNLSPEGAAVMWGLSEEPDKRRVVSTVASFLELVADRELRDLNVASLVSLVMAGLGTPLSPGRDVGATDVATAALPSSEAGLSGLIRLYGDPAFAPLRAQLEAIATAFPAPLATLGAIRRLDVGSLRALLDDGSSGDPFQVAAASLQSAQVIVFGHTHTPGGLLATLPDGRAYANTGSWLPTQRVETLKALGIAWNALDLGNRAHFPTELPVVVITYDGAGDPCHPHLVHIGDLPMPILPTACDAP